MAERLRAPSRAECGRQMSIQCSAHTINRNGKWLASDPVVIANELLIVLNYANKFGAYGECLGCVDREERREPMQSTLALRSSGVER